MVKAETATASPVLAIGSKITALLKPFFAATAKLQAGEYDEEEVQARIKSDIDSSTIVIYSYSLSPFCTEAETVVQSLGVDYKVITLGAEWIPGLLDKEGAVVRCELGELTGQTSMPHIFINGQTVGGLFSGTPGLMPLVESGEIDELLGEPEPESESEGLFAPLKKFFEKVAP